MEKLCIDVRGFSEEKKKRVQDAFFALGIKWFLRNEQYMHLDACSYVNVSVYGESDEHLMYGSGDLSEAQKPYKVTYTKLMQKAGLPIDDPDELDVSGRKLFSSVIGTREVVEFNPNLHETIKSYICELEHTQETKAREILVAHIENLVNVEFYRLTGAG